jgi:hypothetical protein
MERRAFLKKSGLSALLPLWPRSLFASKIFRRRRPSDANWPSEAAWTRLNDQVDGNLTSVEFPIDACIKDIASASCKSLIANIKNPYYIGFWWQKPTPSSPVTLPNPTYPNVPTLVMSGVTRFCHRSTAGQTVSGVFVRCAL